MRCLAVLHPDNRAHSEIYFDEGSRQGIGMLWLVEGSVMRYVEGPSRQGVLIVHGGREKNRVTRYVEGPSRKGVLIV